MNQIPNEEPEAGDALPLFRLLVFTETAGFHHKSIADGAAALNKMARRNVWGYHRSETSEFFTDRDLAFFDVVVFLSTTGDVLNEEEQAAFERYIQKGGGFVGIHAATDTEYGWPWFNRLVGAYFNGHPRVQPAMLDVLVLDHPSTAHLPKRWERRDEWYNFKSLNPDVQVLMQLDEGTYKGGGMGPVHPIAWFHEFDGGRAWYTGGGHTKESFSEDAFLEHIEGGIRWVGGLSE